MKIGKGTRNHAQIHNNKGHAKSVAEAGSLNLDKPELKVCHKKNMDSSNFLDIDETIEGHGIERVSEAGWFS